MVVLPEHYAEHSVAELLESASYGLIGRDLRWVRAIVGRPGAGAEILQFVASAPEDQVDALEPDLTIMLDYLGAEADEVFLGFVRKHPEDVSEQLMEAILRRGSRMLEPLLALAEDLDEEQQGDVAFLLAGIGIHDDRVKQLLLDHFDYSASDGALALGLYKDPSTIPAIEQVMAELAEDPDPDNQLLRGDLAATIESIRSPESRDLPAKPDLQENYPDYELPEFSEFDDEELPQVLDSSEAAYRAAALGELFNREYPAALKDKVRGLAETDPEPYVRAQALAALATHADQKEVAEYLTGKLVDATLDPEQRAGAAIGLHTELPELSDPRIRKALEELYEEGSSRARILEAMWRSLERDFAPYMAKHIDDPDPDIRKQAILGSGYLNVKSVLKRVEELFADGRFRPDALFAYALMMPAEVSRGRVKGMYRKIEELAEGLSEDETGLVEAALDERLMMHGLSPVFHTGGAEGSEDSETTH